MKLKGTPVAKKLGIGGTMTGSSRGIRKWKWMGQKKKWLRKDETEEHWKGKCLHGEEDKISYGEEKLEREGTEQQEAEQKE